jgi:tetratricopeptide (TPR) repeat protein
MTMRWIKTVLAIIGGVTVLMAVLAALAYGVYAYLGDVSLARQAAQTGKYAEAIQHYDKALATYLPGSFRARLYLERGTAHMQLLQRELAIADYDEALKINPRLDFAFVLRALARIGTKDSDKAIGDLNEAIRINPTNAQALYWRGRTYEARLDLDHAIADFDAVTRIMPQMTDAYLRSSYSHARRHETAQAVAVIDAMPAGQYDADAHVVKAGAYDNAGATDRALFEYGQALQIAPNSAYAYGQRGLANSNSGHHENAMADYAKAISLAPGNGRVFYFRGREEYLYGHYADAAADLKQALVLTPGQPYDVLWLRLALARLGQDNPQALSEAATKISSEGWPQPVIEFYLGQRTAASTEAEARKSDEPATVMDRVCEAVYYNAALKLARGSRQDATPLLHQAVAICPPGFVELYAARIDLKRLGE